MGYICGFPQQFKHDCLQHNNNAYLHSDKNDLYSKQNYRQQRSGHQNHKWHCQRNLTGHINCMTSVSSSTAFVTTKYCKNFERKYSDDSVWIIDTYASDHMTSNNSNLSSYKSLIILRKLFLGIIVRCMLKMKGSYIVILTLVIIMIRF